MKRHPWKRVAAWVIDCALLCAYAGVIALVCVPLYLAGVITDLPQVLGNLVATLVLVVPAVLVLAWLEAGPRSATIGKRVMGLCLGGSNGERVAYSRALWRNAIKFAVPWLIGHAAVYALWNGPVQGPIPGWVWPLLALSYAIPIIWVVSLFVRDGRTPYDRWTGTIVTGVGHASWPRRERKGSVRAQRERETP